MSAATTINILYSARCIYRVYFPDGNGIDVSLDMLYNSLFPDVYEIFYQCPCRVMYLYSRIIADRVRANNLPAIRNRARFSPFHIERADLYNEEFYCIVLRLRSRYRTRD